MFVSFLLWFSIWTAFAENRMNCFIHNIYIPFTAFHSLCSTNEREKESSFFCWFVRSFPFCIHVVQCNTSIHLRALFRIIGNLASEFNCIRSLKGFSSIRSVCVILHSIRSLRARQPFFVLTLSFRDSIRCLLSRVTP